MRQSDMMRDINHAYINTAARVYLLLGITLRVDTFDETTGDGKMLKL